MKAAWAKRKAAKAAEGIAQAETINVKMELSEGFKVARDLENEMRRRDEELIAEWKNAIANLQPNRIVGMGVGVPWSVIDAIIKALNSAF